MVHETHCPACGAPITYSGEEDVVRCGFCNTELRVRETNGQTQFEILAKPRPQADVLTEQAEEVTGEVLEDFSTVSTVIEEPAVVDREPVAPGYASWGTTESTPQDFVPASTTSIPDSPTPIPETSPYQVGRATVGGTQGRNRWIGIGIAIFAAVCLLCVVAVLAIFFAIGGRVNF